MKKYFSLHRQIILLALFACMANCARTPPIKDLAPRFDPSAADNMLPESAYPTISRRLHEEGVAIIALLILEDGSVGKVEVVNSSGSQRLDDAAINWYSHHGKFLPGTKLGKPIAAWKTLKVTFKLREPDNPE